METNTGSRRIYQSLTTYVKYAIPRYNGMIQHVPRPLSSQPSFHEFIVGPWPNTSSIRNSWFQFAILHAANFHCTQRRRHEILFCADWSLISLDMGDITLFLFVVAGGFHKTQYEMSRMGFQAPLRLSHSQRSSTSPKLCRPDRVFKSQRTNY
jgi:hypothetical protein